jgi:hypothetical protein
MYLARPMWSSSPTAQQKNVILHIYYIIRNSTTSDDASEGKDIISPNKTKSQAFPSFTFEQRIYLIYWPIVALSIKQIELD